MEKKITLYIVALASVVAAVDAANVTEKDGIHILKSGVVVEGVHAVGTDFHSINLCFGHVVELCPDAETLAVLQHLYGVCNAVYHAQVRIVE